MRFASRENAIISQWEIGAALVSADGPIARLPRLIGRGRALEVLLSGSDINGEIAERYGYVNRSLPDTDLDRLGAATVPRLRTGGLVERRSHHRIAAIVAQWPRKTSNLDTAQSTCDRALLQICISESRGRAASLVSAGIASLPLSATERSNVSPTDTRTNSPIRSAASPRNRGTASFRTTGRLASEFAGIAPKAVIRVSSRRKTVNSLNLHKTPTL